MLIETLFIGPGGWKEGWARWDAFEDEVGGRYKKFTASPIADLSAVERADVIRRLGGEVG